jgi:PhzF family phenazine biosynthesis protein
MKKYIFHQVDVFTKDPLFGNPLAVVHGADDLAQTQMAKFANWNNLSETTYIQKPINPLADYRVRIFTPTTELPFAGHPTLGSCYAWLENGGVPKSSEFIYQECEIGLIKIRRENDLFSFSAPNLIRTGPLEQDTLKNLLVALDLKPADVVHHQWVDNGPGWCALMLRSSEHVLSIKPDPEKLKGFKVGLIGPYLNSNEIDFEVRAFVVPFGITEDPVTGSLNAGIASWLLNSALSKDLLKNSPYSYTVSQGTALGRRGRVFVKKLGQDIWVGGNVVSCIQGSVHL